MMNNTTSERGNSFEGNFIYVSLAVIGVTTVIGSTINFLVLKNVKITTVSQNLLLRILACTDFTIAAVLILDVLQANLLKSIFICKVLVFVIAICCGATTKTLTLIALDKLLSILRPLRYHSLISPVRIVTIEVVYDVLLIAWTSYIFTDERFLDLVEYSSQFRLCFPPYRNQPVGEGITTSFIFVLLPLIIIITCYVWIGLIARKQNRKVRNSTNSAAPGGIRNNREWKGIRIAILVTTAFLVSWLPVCLISSYGEATGNEVPFIVHIIGFSFAFSNSWWNTVSHFALYKEFRVKFRELFVQRVA